jgi:hypothetical protein
LNNLADPERAGCLINSQVITLASLLRLLCSHTSGGSSVGQRQVLCPETKTNTSDHVRS